MICSSSSPRSAALPALRKHRAEAADDSSSSERRVGVFRIFGFSRQAKIRATLSDSENAAERRRTPNGTISSSSSSAYRCCVTQPAATRSCSFIPSRLLLLHVALWCLRYRLLPIAPGWLVVVELLASFSSSFSSGQPQVSLATAAAAASLSLSLLQRAPSPLAPRPPHP